MNRLGVGRIAAYVLIGIVVWVCVLKSGVHATLAGFVVALTIPLKHPEPAYAGSPLRHLEHSLHPWVAFMILPLFAFANAGVSFAGMTAGELTGGVATGIVLGLFIGKQIGVFATSALLIKLRLAELPRGASWSVAVRRRDAHRHRLHDEPVHRRARVRTFAGRLRRAAARGGARRVGALRGRRIFPAAHHIEAARERMPRRDSPHILRT